MENLVRFASSGATGMENDQQRLMHQGPGTMANVMPQQNVYDQNMQSGDPDQRKQEIGDILQQIMTITDQSLDEAQARWVDRRVNFCFRIRILKFGVAFRSSEQIPREADMLMI